MMENDLIRRYLLGELSEAEQTALEDEYFLDQAKYDQLCKTEDDLIDDYVRGSLSAADSERFRQCYLTNPHRRHHVHFARALTHVVDAELDARSAAQAAVEIRQVEVPDTHIFRPSRLIDLFHNRRFAWVLALTIAMLFIGLGEVWMVMETFRLRTRIAEKQRENEMQQQQAQTQAREIVELNERTRQLTEERNRMRAQLQSVQGTVSSSRPAATPVFFVLSINVFRNFGDQRMSVLVIPSDVKEVRLRLNLAELQFPSYRVMLQTTEGREVFSRDGLVPQAGKSGDFVMVNLPASKFASGDNVIELSGISATGEVETLGKTMIKVRKR